MPHAETLFPPKPLEGINWAALGSTITEDNGHVECRYSIATGVWTEPIVVKDPYIKVHGLAPGLNYGQQAYEGMKAYRSPTDAINIFRPQYHAKRLANSSSCVSIPPIPENVYLEAVNLAVACNAAYVPPHSASALMYIRPVVFGSAGNLGLTPPSEYTFAVYTQPGNAYHGIQPMPAVVMEEFDRSAPRGTGGYKVGGNYAPCIKWQGKARQMGYGLTLHLDSKSQSEIEEFSTSGFIGVRRDEAAKTTLCIPDSMNIVDSVTSDSIAKIGESLGWIVEKRKIHYSELRYFTEVLAVGTAASIVPIASIHRISTEETFVYNHSGEGSAGKPGPVCVQLSQLLLDIQKGSIKDSWGWRWEVKDPTTMANSELPTEQTGELIEEEAIGDGANGCEVIENESNAQEITGGEFQEEEIHREKAVEKRSQGDHLVAEKLDGPALQEYEVSGENSNGRDASGRERIRENLDITEIDQDKDNGETVLGNEPNEVLVIQKEGYEVEADKDALNKVAAIAGTVKEEKQGSEIHFQVKISVEKLDEENLYRKSVSAH